MAAKLRPTGLSILGDVPWGIHLCIFYETMQDLLDTLVPYFHAGLENNEFVIWAVSDPLTVEEAHAAMARGISDYQEYLSRGQIEIIEGSEWYLGRDLKKVTDGWHEKLEAALARGFAGMRATAMRSGSKRNIAMTFSPMSRSSINRLPAARCWSCALIRCAPLERRTCSMSRARIISLRRGEAGSGNSSKRPERRRAIR